MTKRPEETIAMACESDVSELAGHRRAREMAYPSAQDVRRIALKNDSFQR
jgi:hypothetical protein